MQYAKQNQYAAYPGIIASPVSGKPIRAFSPMPSKKKQVKKKSNTCITQKHSNNQNPIYKNTSYLTTTYSNITCKSHFKSTTKSYSFNNSNSWYIDSLNKETNIILVSRSSINKTGKQRLESTQKFSITNISYYQSKTDYKWKQKKKLGQLMC